MREGTDVLSEWHHLESIAGTVAVLSRVTPYEAKTPGGLFRLLRRQ